MQGYVCECVHRGFVVRKRGKIRLEVGRRTHPYSTVHFRIHTNTHYPRGMGSRQGQLGINGCRGGGCTCACVCVCVFANASSACVSMFVLCAKLHPIYF